VLRVGEHPQREAVGEREQDRHDRLGVGVQRDHALAALGLELLGHVLADAPVERGQLGRDLGRAAGGGEELEVQRDEGRVPLHQVLERADQHVQQVVGGAGGRDSLVERGEPQVGVAPHDLDEQPLLGAEVVVQEPARDAGLARDVVEGRARRAARRHRRAHRVHDALRLVAAEGRCRLHAADASWPSSQHSGGARRAVCHTGRRCAAPSSPLC
jgi:hypothetical protein